MITIINTISNFYTLQNNQFLFIDRNNIDINGNLLPQPPVLAPPNRYPSMTMYSLDIYFTRDQMMMFFRDDYSYIIAKVRIGGETYNIGRVISTRLDTNNIGEFINTRLINGTLYSYKITINLPMPLVGDITFFNNNIVDAYNLVVECTTITKEVYMKMDIVDNISQVYLSSNLINVNNTVNELIGTKTYMVEYYINMVYNNKTYGSILLSRVPDRRVPFRFPFKIYPGTNIDVSYFAIIRDASYQFELVTDTIKETLNSNNFLLDVFPDGIAQIQPELLIENDVHVVNNAVLRPQIVDRVIDRNLQPLFLNPIREISVRIPSVRNPVVINGVTFRPDINNEISIPLSTYLEINARIDSNAQSVQK